MSPSNSAQTHIAPPPERFVVLDSWRGIAALVVALYHCGYQWHWLDASIIRHGWLCVDFFFVLSGFVISHAYGRRLATGRDFGAFMIRRTGRLWPLHVFMLALFVAPWARSRLVSLLTGSDFVDSGDNNLYSIMTNLLLVHSLGLHSIATWNPPSWSISTEYYTNVLYGLAVLLCGRFIGVAAFALAIAGAAAVIVFAGGDMGTSIHYGLFRCMYGFFTGSLVYLLFQNTPAVPRIGTGPATALEIGALALAVGLIGHGGGAGLSMLAPLVFGFAVLIFAGEGGIVSRLLRHRLFLTLGILSYSIYMTHAFIYYWLLRLYAALGRGWQIDFLVPDARDVFHGNVWIMDGLTAVYVAAVIAASVLTYRFVEQPWRRRFNRTAGAVEGGGRVRA